MAKQKIYGLSERDLSILKVVIREHDRTARPVVLQRSAKPNSSGHIHYFRNDSGETIPAGGIMRKTGTELVDGALTYVMNKPTTVLDNPYSWFVNLGRDIPDDDHGWCSTFEDEPGLAYYLSGTITVGDWWGPKPSQWNLERYYLGFRIDGNADNGLVVVKQHAITELFGTLDGSLSQGSSATMSVYTHDGSSWVDTTANITVYDRLLKSGAAAVQSGKWVVAQFYSGRWWATSAECNT